MNWTKGKLIVTSGLGVLMLSGIGASQALASTASSQATGTLTSTTSPAVPVSREHTHGGRLFSGQVLNSMAAYFGMTQNELRTELTSGKSLEDIGKEHGKTASDVQAAMKTAVQNALENRVKAGSLTADKASALEQKMSARLPKLTASKHLLQPRHGFKERERILAFSAKQLNMTLPQLMSELHSGKSLSQVATEHNVSPDTLKAQIEQKLTKQLDRRIDALFSKKDWGAK